MADVNANIGVNIDTSEALAQLKALQRQISQFHTSIAKSSEAAGLAQRDLQKNFINSINSIGAFSAELRTVKTTAESFTDSLQNNKFSMREYFRYAGASTKTFGKLFKSEFDTIGKVAEDRVKRLQTQYIKLGRDTNGAMKSIAVMPNQLDMNNYGTQAQLAAQKQAIFNQLVKQGSTNLLNFGKNTQWAGRQLMVGFTLPLATLGTTASRTFMEMEAQIIKFRKVYGDLFTPTEETNQALENITALGEMFTKYGISVSQTVGLAAEAAAAGFSGVDLQRQTTEATRLQVLGQIDAQKALETTISLQNAFSMSSENLASSIDFLNAVENQTVVSLDDITTAIPKVAPVIQQLGGDVKDLTFFIAAMKEGGINASEGANALKSGLAALINPTTKASEMLKTVGINVRGIIEANKGDLKATVIGFAQALDTLAPLDRARAIEQMFGKFQFARLSTLFQNVTRDGNQASRVLELAGTSIEDLASLSEQELGLTANSAMNKFKQSVETLKLALVPVGKTFLEAVTPIVDFIGGILEKFNSLSSGVKKAIVVLTVAIGAIGPIALMTFGLLANALANILKGAMVLRQGYLRLTGQTQILGEQTNYLNMEQLDAAAASHSLDQSHARLTQTFTAEAGAISQLIAAYQQATAAGARFATLNPGMMATPNTKTPKKFASGVVSVPGPKGAGDVIPAMLSPGESVIPADMTKKYGGLINGMVADNIPGYANGLSYGGKEYNIPIRSQSGIDAVLLKFSKDVLGITNVLDALERQASELGTGFKLSADSLKSMLDAQNVARNNPKGTASSGGYVFAHAMEPIESITDSAKLMDLAMTKNLGELKKYLESAATSAGGYANVMSNFGFVLPAEANKGKMSPQSVAKEFQGANVSRTMSPVFEEYARSLGMNLDQALSDPSIKQQMTSDINQYASAISNEISKVPSQFLDDPSFYTAVSKAEQGLTNTVSSILNNVIANLKTPTTIATFGGEANRGTMGQRTGIPKKAEELRAQLGTAEDITSYRGRTSVYIKEGEQIGFAIGQASAQGIIQGAREVLRSQSPSEELKNVGRDGGKGLILGAQESIDDAKIVGQQIATAVVSGAGGGKSGITMSQLQSNVSIGNETKAAAAENINKIKTMNEKMNKLNSAIMGGTFALTSLAGAGSMAGGTLGSISQQVMKYSGLLFGLMSVTQLLTQTKIAELVATRLAVAKQAAAFASYGTGIASGSGILGILARVGVRLLAFAGPLGAITAGLSAIVVGYKILKSAQEKQTQAIEGFGKALNLTADQIKKFGDIYGFVPIKSPLESAKIGSGIVAKDVATSQRVAEVKETFKKDKGMQSNISELQKATDKQAKLIFQSIGLRLKASGATEQAVKEIIIALQEESGKTSLDIDFKSIDLATPEGKASLQKSADSLIKSFNSQFINGYSESKTSYVSVTGEIVEVVNKNLSEKLKKSLSTTSNAFSNFFFALSGQFASGVIDVDQFGQSFDGMVESIAKLKSPQQLELMSALISKLPEDVAKATAGLGDFASQMLIIKAAAVGVAVTAQQIAMLTSMENPNASMQTIMAGLKTKQAIIDAIAAQGKAMADALSVGTKIFGEQGKENPLKAKIKDIKNQTEAYILLRNAKISDKIATELSNDAEIASIVIAANKGKKLKKVIALVKEYTTALKDQSNAARDNREAPQVFKDTISQSLALANLREKLIDISFDSKLKIENDELVKQENNLGKINDQIESINKNQIDPLQAIIESNNYELEAIGIIEDSINEKYNTQIEALDKIAQANQQINNLQKQRLSIADALTTGDISAAAAAVQEARTQQAQNIVEAQKTSLTDSRDSAIALLGRKAIEQENKDLQFQIATIQKQQLLILQEQKITIEDKIKSTNNNISAIQKEVDLAKQALTYNGLTRIELEKFDDLIGLAEAAGIEFNASLLAQASSAAALAAALGLAADEQLRLSKNKLNTGSSVSGEPAPASYSSYYAMTGRDLPPGIESAPASPSSTSGTYYSMTGRDMPSNLAKMASGGLVPKYFALGGFAKGSDTVPAMLTPGEFVVSKYAVDKFGVDNLKSINNGTPSSSSNSVYNYGINVNVSNSNSSTDDIARAVIKQIKNIDNQRIRGQRY